MSITALKKIVPDWFTPSSEKDGDDPTKFKIRALTSPQLEDVFEFVQGQGLGVPPRNYSRVLKHGLVDWTDNFCDENDKKLKSNFTNHDRIPFGIRSELVGEIIVRSQLDEDDSGN